MATDVRRNEAIVAAMSKHFSNLSIDPKKIMNNAVEEQNILSLFTSILQLSGGDSCVKSKDEVMKWVKFANDFPSEADKCHSVLTVLNEELCQKSVLVGDRLKPSEADIVVYSALHSFVSRLSKSDMQRVPNVIRWMDYIQNVEDFGGAFEKILVEKAMFQHPGLKNGNALNADQSSKKTTQPLEEKKMADLDPKISMERKVPIESKLSEDKKKTPAKEAAEKKAPGKEPAEKNAEVSVSALNIQVGIIRKAWKHPSADSLLVEEIDLGNGNLRQVVSGLAKYFSPDDLTDRCVALITNVKPGKLRDVMSSGLVLCASSQDHTVVEPLLPPPNSMPGERIFFPGYDGKPEDVLNPKKKQLEKITPDLYTDDNGVATYKGVPFMTSTGPCTSSIPKASIK